MVVLFAYVLIFTLFYYFRNFFSEKLEMINLNQLLPTILFFKGTYFFPWIVWSNDEDVAKKIG